MPARPKSPHLYLEEDRGYETPCWVWQRSTAGSGYGHLRVDGKLWLAHRYFWTQKNGPIPEGKQIDHRCGVILCCNPDHCEPVTSAENARRSRATKLSAEDVEQIRERLIAGAPTNLLAQEYGVQTLQIWRIKRRLSWVAA